MVYKGKGSSDATSKYRCICFLTHAYKLLSAMLLRQLARECEAWLAESQVGFRRFCSEFCCYENNIFIVAVLIDDVIGRNVEAYIVFIDFVAALDSVSHIGNTSLSELLR